MFPRTPALRWPRRPVASAETLAAFRIAVGIALLLSTELHAGSSFADLPAAMRIAPEGLGWFVAVAPISKAIALVVRAVAVAAAAATILGLYTQAATLALCFSSFYLLAIGQLGGTVVHNMHLVWFAAILAASPAGDALSVDRFRECVPSPDARYGVPVWTARILFACVYFFPGLHKVMTQGLQWASAENLSLQLYWKWFEWNEVPAFRLDQHPTLLQLGGFATLAFELGFPFLLVSRPTRLAAAVLGVAFHMATDWLLHVAFSSLWICYPVLVDWPRRQRHQPDTRGTASPWPRAAAAVGALLVLPTLAQGLRGKTDAFPFACYPTFAYRASDTIPDLTIVSVGADGARTEIAHGRDARGLRSQAHWGLVWALVGATAPLDEARLHAYASSLGPGSMWPPGGTVELWRSEFAVSPDARGRPAVRATKLTSLNATRLRPGPTTP